VEAVKGTVVGGKVVFEGQALPDGTEVAVLVARQERSVRLSPHLQRELESALEEADRVEGISVDALLAELRKIGRT
jgi:hypothetical protein